VNVNVSEAFVSFINVYMNMNIRFRAGFVGVRAASLK
jgi:hypothetical protein